MASLGFLWAYDALNVPDIVLCERFFADPPTFPAGRAPVSLERGRALADCDVVAVSISYEPDIVNLVRILAAADIPPLVDERGDDHPFVIIGGPLARANHLPLLAMADAVVLGDGEAAVQALVHAFDRGCTDRNSLCAALQGKGGVATKSGGADRCFNAESGVLPVVSRVVTPNSSLPGLQLVEVSRGCPKACTFCIGRSDSTPPRQADVDDVLAAIDTRAPGIGIIGAALGFYPGLPRLLEWAARAGRRAGVSSLRAERVNLDVARLLKATGAEVLTVAADGPSERLRRSILKQVTEADLVRCAELARKAGLNAMKVYVMVGLPGERDQDILELATLVNRLNRIIPVVLSQSVFVPKKGTPLAQSRFGPVSTVSSRLNLLRKECSGGVRLGRVSPREAAIQYLISHADSADGEALVRASLAGGKFGDFRREFPDRIKRLL